MAKIIEVDEEEYQRNARLRGTLDKIMANPAARKKVLEAYRDVDPSTPIPELDAEQRVAAPIDDLRKELKALKDEREADKAERTKAEQLAKLNADWDQGRAKLRRAQYTEEGITAIEKFMEEKGLVDHEIGAAAFERLHPPAAPATPSHTGGWNFLESVTDADKDIKALIETKGESNPLLDKMAREALAEIRGPGRR